MSVDFGLGVIFGFALMLIALFICYFLALGINLQSYIENLERTRK
jgi:hypothetical protein